MRTEQTLALVNKIARKVLCDLDGITIELNTPQRHALCRRETVLAPSAGPQVLYDIAHEAVESLLSRYYRGCLGDIAASGVSTGSDSIAATSLYAVHKDRRDPWLDPRASGSDLMLKIAVIAVVARMFDVLTAELEQRLAHAREHASATGASR